MKNSQQKTSNYPMRDQEIQASPVYVVKAASTDLLMAQASSDGVSVQIKGNALTAQTQVITHLQNGEKLKLMQCDPLSNDTHAVFQTLPDDGLFPLSGVVKLEDLVLVSDNEQA